MGSCGLKQEVVKIEYIPIPAKLVYHRLVKLYIHMKNIPNFAKGVHTFKFTLAPPQQVFSSTLTIKGNPYYLSHCVLPSTDPWGKFNKSCQDACFSLSDEDSILTGVYDGHGKNGRDVVKFCIDYIKSDFQRNKLQYTESPPVYLDKITKQCDQQLKNQTEFDVSLSGSTQILVYIIDQVIYIANLGDSKAMLATKQRQEISPYQLPIKRTNTLEAVRNKRMLPQTQLNVIKLTKDHVPSDATEKDRIELCGGRVQRMTDQGKFIGPNRVWCQNANKPGLAMSRSLGDRVASGIGVISTPTIQSHQIDPQMDAFMVIATDGIWDVMEFEEVCNFVQSFRAHCVDQPVIVDDGVTPSNSCIAHLLCEEARLRWLTLVECENVMIDDIGCVVIEFNKDVSKEPNKFMKRVSYSVHGIEEEEEFVENGQGLDRNHFVMRDAFRASNVEEMSDEQINFLY